MAKSSARFDGTAWSAKALMLLVLALSSTSSSTHARETLVGAWTPPARQRIFWERGGGIWTHPRPSIQIFAVLGEEHAVQPVRADLLVPSIAQTLTQRPNRLFVQASLSYRPREPLGRDHTCITPAFRVGENSQCCLVVLPFVGSKPSATQTRPLGRSQRSLVGPGPVIHQQLLAFRFQRGWVCVSKQSATSNPGRSELQP
jgi:hypothetical protein